MPHRPQYRPVARRRNPSRRAFLGGAVAMGTSLAGTPPWPAHVRGGETPATTWDYATREAFDHYDRAWNGGMGNTARDNEHGALGWGQGWLLASYLVMYQAHRDRHYLDKFVEHVDLVLARRDSERGVADWRGLSLPSWRSAGEYTAGQAVLTDATGRPILALRSAARPAHRVSITVIRAGEANAFKLTAALAPPPRDPAAGAIEDVYDQLTMDPSAQSYAVRHINDAFARINGTSAGPRVMLTASDVRPDDARHAHDTPQLSEEPIALTALPFIYAVQAGQILTPMAAFVRLVHDTPELRSEGPFADKAEQYLDAVERAVEVHDEEWQEKASSGEGWLQWPKGSPNVFDGCDQPHNQYLSLGRTMVHLSALARDASRRQLYRDRAIKMARTFKNDLRPTPAGGVSWSYFWSNGRPYHGWTDADQVSQNQPMMVWPRTGGFAKVEDTSHGVLDVDFARLTYEYDLGVFDEQDMHRFARTFTQQILTTGDDGQPTTFENVDGTGRKGALDNAAAGWLTFARFDPQIFSAMRANYAHRQPPPGPPTIPLGIAYLNRHRVTAGS